MTHRQNISSLLAVSLAFLILHVSASFAAQATGAAPADWDRTVKAAEGEGALTIYMTQGFEPVFREAFQKKHPKIKVNTVVGRGFQLGQRIMSERRAEKYLVDFWLTGNITPVTVFYKAKILDPVKPLLALPEVVNEGLWFEGKHHYYDPENRYVFAFEGTPRSGELTFNTKLVNPNEIRSFWQLLDAKWKGKIVTIDPLIAGPINSAQISFTSTPTSALNFSSGFTAKPTWRLSDPMSSSWIG